MIHASESWRKIVGKLLRGRTKNRREIPMISKYSVFFVGTRRINAIFMSKKFSVPLTRESVTSGQAGGVFCQLFYSVVTWKSSVPDPDPQIFAKLATNIVYPVTQLPSDAYPGPHKKQLNCFWAHILVQTFRKSTKHPGLACVINYQIRRRAKLAPGFFWCFFITSLKGAVKFKEHIASIQY